MDGVAALARWSVVRCANPQCPNLWTSSQGRYLGRVESGAAILCPKCGYITRLEIRDGVPVMTSKQADR